MSARLLQKVLREQEQLLTRQENENENDSDADSIDSRPTRPAANPFDLLDAEEDANELSEVGSPQDDSQRNSVEDKVDMAVSSVKTKKKKKKKKKNEEKVAYVDANTKDESIDLQLERLSVSEAGTSSVASSEIPAPTGNSRGRCILQKCSTQILAIDPKFLRAEDELRRIFGSKVVNAFESSHNSGNSRRKQVPRGGAHNYHIRRTILVAASDHWPRWDGGLSMEHIETKGGLKYFRYSHLSIINFADSVPPPVDM